MPLAVDQLELGPIGTNTYLVRPSATAAEAVVVDPSGDAATIRERARRASAPAAPRSSSRTATSTTSSASPTSPSAPARPSTHRRASASCSRSPTRSRRPGSSSGRATRRRLARRVARRSTRPGSRSPSLAVPGHSPAHLAYFADGDLFSGDVLFAGSVGRTDLPGRRLGARSRRRSRRSSTRIRPRRSSIPGTARETTLGAELAHEPVPRRAARGAGSRDERQDRAPARHARRRPRRDAALAARHGRGRAALRALRLPQDPDPGVRGHGAVRAHRPGRAPTSSRRRCTASPTAPTAR